MLRAIHHTSSLLQPPLPSPSFWPISKHFGTEEQEGGHTSSRASCSEVTQSLWSRPITGVHLQAELCPWDALASLPQ